jgi:hypothetical protein
MDLPKGAAGISFSIPEKLLLKTRSPVADLGCGRWHQLQPLMLYPAIT